MWDIETFLKIAQVNSTPDSFTVNQTLNQELPTFINTSEDEIESKPRDGCNNNTGLQNPSKISRNNQKVKGSKMLKIKLSL